MLFSLVEKLFRLLFSTGAQSYKQDNKASVRAYVLTGKVLCFAHLKTSFISLLIRCPVLQQDNMGCILLYGITGRVLHCFA